MTQPDQSRLESPSFASGVSTRLGELAIELIEAGRTDDRERFDRLYAIAFGTAYGEAWRSARSAPTAQALAARALVRALQLALESSRRSGPDPRSQDTKITKGDLAIPSFARGRS